MRNLDPDVHRFRSGKFGVPFGPGFPLQSPVAALPPISTAIPNASARKGALRADACQEGLQVRASLSEDVPGGTAERGPCRWRDIRLL